MNEIEKTLKLLASGELSLGAAFEKLPACPRCGKHNLTAGKGHTGFFLQCFRECGWAHLMETRELLASAREALRAAGSRHRQLPMSEIIRRKKERAAEIADAAHESGQAPFGW